MNRFQQISIAGLIVMSIASTFPGEAAGNSSRALYSKAVSAINKSNYDSAFYYLQTACVAGLPDDSLYYLWARIYLERGVPDTALALNLAAARTDTRTLGAPLLEQRYLIYATLGWTSEARLLLDSLSQRQSRAGRYVPRLSIQTWLGDNYRNLIEGQPYPFTATSAAEPIWNPGHEITVKTEWFIPAWKATTFVPGLHYNFANGLEQTELRYDSLDHSIGISLGLRNLLPHLSIDYSLLRQINIFKDYSTRHQISFSRSMQGARWLAYSSLLYTIEKPDNGAVSYQCFWFMNYLSRPISSSTSIFLLPLFTFFLADATSSSYTTSLMFIEDPQTSPVIHYTDSTFVQPIPVPSPLTMISQMQLLGDYRAASVQRSFYQYTPESYCSVTPALGLTQSLPFKISLEGTLKGMANYYLREYEWTTYSIPYSTEYYDHGTWIAYSSSDGNYYLVREFGNIVNAEKYSGPLAVKSVKKRRIDCYASGEILFERRFWNGGTLGINGYIRKYWSTLQYDSPVQQKDLVFGFGVSLKIAIGAAIPANVF